MDTNGKLHHKLQALKGHHAGAGTGKVLGEYDLADRGKTEADLSEQGKADQIAAHAKQAASQAGVAARDAGKRFKKRAIRRLGMVHARLHHAGDGAHDDGAAQDRRGPEA